MWTDATAVMKVEDPMWTDAKFGEKAILKNGHRKNGSRQAADNKIMSQNIDLFRKYLLTKAKHNNIRKTNMEDSEIINKRLSPPRPLIPPNFRCSLGRCPSFLEQQLLPGIGGSPFKSPSGAIDKSSKSQLTIFYAGSINVYDNVPIDKAQAIMLLAGESSLSKPIADEMPKTDHALRSPLSPARNLDNSAGNNITAGLPIARKISLQHFLEKRRRRITNKSPYAPPSKEEIVTDNDNNKEIKLLENSSSIGNRSISLSPFPSRLGYFFPVSAANKGCQA